MIVIVDYGLGNLQSIRNMLRKIGADGVISGDPAVVRDATRLILPGVGAFDEGMRSIEAAGLVAPLRTAALERGVPLLGICLGMQLLGRRSEEGTLPGLGFLDADVVRFAFGDRPPLKVPHMGWNYIRPARPDPLLAGLEHDARFYFVHTYHMVCHDPADSLAEAEYGIPFCAAVRRGTIAAVQFHPEKSHRFGMRLLQNFVAT